MNYYNPCVNTDS